MIHNQHKRDEMAKHWEKWSPLRLKRKKYDNPEGEIVKSILAHLHDRGIMCWRNNSGAFKNDNGGFYRFGEVGSPDIFCIVKRTASVASEIDRYGVLVGLEVKSPVGTASEAQKRFGEAMRGAGAVWEVVRSVDDVDEILRGLT